MNKDEYLYWNSIVFDLDGVLADYTGGYSAHEDFPGEPIPGVIAILQRLKDKGEIIGIFSTRKRELIWEWLEYHGLEDLVDWVNENPFQPEDGSAKPIYKVLIDDRCLRFNGDNMEEIVDRVLSDKVDPWYSAKIGD